MSSLVYERPKSVKEALKAIQDGTPLGGGTRLTAHRQAGIKYVDLQELGLDKVKEIDQGWELGAMVRVEALIDSNIPWPPALRMAARRQAGWNLRNQASLGGVVMAVDGRSPLLTVFLAAGVQIKMEPGEQQLALVDLLSQRDDLEGVLLTEILLPRLEALAYEQVSRSPADRPIVCAAAAKLAGTEPHWRIAIGGYGAAPILIHEGEFDPASCCRTAAKTYAKAGDEWATSEYRAEVASVLAARVLDEVQ